MSANASPQNIPIRRIQISHPSQIPSDYGTTPGGTMFSTTPGGTRIIYDRLFLLKCRDSPLSKTPPPNLPDIPGVTTPDRSPMKHVIGKIPEESRENGKTEGQPYQAPNRFSYPPPGYNFNNNNFHLDVPQPQHPYPMKNYGGRLVQYRQRQCMMAQMKDNPFPSPPPFYNVNVPIMDPEYRGIFSPPPMMMDNHPHPSPPFFVHPIQSPTGPIFDQRPIGHMSKLSNWRRSQSQNISSQGFSTSKAPRLRSSFSDGEGIMMDRGRGRGFVPPPQFNNNFNAFRRHNSTGDSRGMSYRSSTSSWSNDSRSRANSSHSENDIFMVMPDDPSIIAYKPLQKHRMDQNANFLPPFSPIPTMGI